MGKKGRNLWVFQPLKIEGLPTFDTPLANVVARILMERIFWLTPNGVPNRALTAHIEWLPGVRLRHSISPVQNIIYGGL